MPRRRAPCAPSDDELLERTAEGEQEEQDGALLTVADQGRAHRHAEHEELHVEEGALYPALHRMHRRGWLEAEWGLSENNRRARYYRLSSEGESALREQVKDWGRMVRVISLVLEGVPA